MGKYDHPAFGGRKAPGQRDFAPHILPSLFEPGVYYLHEQVRGEHATTTIRGEANAQAMLTAAREKVEET